MIIKAKTPKGAKTKVYDAQGKLISTCFQYNTKTREVSMYLLGTPTKPNQGRVLMKKVRSKPGSFKWKILTVKVKIPGSYAIIDGIRY